MKKILTNLLILFMILGVSSCKDDVTTPNDKCECIKCNDYEVGETFSIDGVTYKVADREMLDEALQNGEDLTKYCTSKVTDMSNMFFVDTSFNQDIGNWDVSNVTNMNAMFLGASSFNEDIGNWDVSNVDGMLFMFGGASSFNKDISNWNVGNSVVMVSMFLEAISFNQDIGNWDVSNVTNMASMFEGAQSFNKDLTNWCVRNVDTEPEGFSTNSALTPENHPLWGTCP